MNKITFMFKTLVISLILISFVGYGMIGYDNQNITYNTIPNNDSTKIDVDSIEYSKNLESLDSLEIDARLDVRKEVLLNKGIASHYGHGDGYHGKRMANGQILDKNKFTCAVPLIKGTKKPLYPFGTKLKITNPETNKSVIVVVTDTGPFSRYGRILDLSYGAFKEIADHRKGLSKIEIYEVS